MKLVVFNRCRVTEPVVRSCMDASARADRRFER
jgi:hypothetical protein